MKIGKITILLVVLTAAVIGTIMSIKGNKTLEVNEYTVYGVDIPEAFDGFRIVHISDLHNASFGKGNENLIALLQSTHPDAIVITGDLIDSRRTDVDTALHFVTHALAIAPVYYASGNHEARIDYASLKVHLLDLGVCVLDNESVLLDREAQHIEFVGLSDPAFSGKKCFLGGMKEILQEKEVYTILLSHRPEYFADYVSSGADLVFSGHAHGGQFRLPWIGGLFAPGQGFLPKYDSGLYHAEKAIMVVSRGLGNSILPIRIGNPPELIVVNLVRLRNE